MRVGLPALTSVRVTPREPVDLMKLALRTSLQFENRLTTEQFQVQERNIKQNVVRRRLCVKLSADQSLPGGQRLEPGIGNRRPDAHAGNRDQLRCNRPCSRANVQRLLGERDDLS